LAEPMKKELNEFENIYRSTKDNIYRKFIINDSKFPSPEECDWSKKIYFTTKYYSYKWVYAEILMICE
jgi:hypothetical protein